LRVLDIRLGYLSLQQCRSPSDVAYAHVMFSNNVNRRFVHSPGGEPFVHRDRIDRGTAPAI
ncbi:MULTISPECIES: hypothetical protein, partial [unclassified Burkholderia]|uniref:hypothetical protein n=1 Tax=unclassified Burkholderia TaxID=2613784 RepID=UPI001C42EDF4